MNKLPIDVEAALNFLANEPSFYPSERDAAVATLREWMNVWAESQLKLLLETIPSLRGRVNELEAEKEARAREVQMGLPI